MPQVLDSIDTYLQELNLVTILFRLALAMGLGGILGIERGKKGQPAALPVEEQASLRDSAPILPYVWPLPWPP